METVERNAAGSGSGEAVLVSTIQICREMMQMKNALEEAKEDIAQKEIELQSISDELQLERRERKMAEEKVKELEKMNQELSARVSKENGNNVFTSKGDNGVSEKAVKMEHCQVDRNLTNESVLSSVKRGLQSILTILNENEQQLKLQRRKKAKKLGKIVNLSASLVKLLSTITYRKKLAKPATPPSSPSTDCEIPMLFEPIPPFDAPEEQDKNPQMPISSSSSPLSLDPPVLYPETPFQQPVKITTEPQSKPHSSNKSCHQINWANKLHCVCGHKSPNKTKLLRHIAGKKFICEVCLNRFRDTWALNNHYWKEHNIRKNIANGCGQCGKTFSSRRELILHKIEERKIT